jgi:hypothetical protein
MAIFGNWTGFPLVGWSFDDQEALIRAIAENEGLTDPKSTYGQDQYDRDITQYKRNFYDSTFKKVLFDFIYQKEPLSFIKNIIIFSHLFLY